MRTTNINKLILTTDKWSYIWYPDSEIDICFEKYGTLKIKQILE